MCVIANSAGAETTPDDFLPDSERDSGGGEDSSRDGSEPAEWVPSADDLREVANRFGASAAARREQSDPK
jgi:hypothetical protein